MGFEVSPPSGSSGAGKKVRRSDSRMELAFKPGERPHDLALEQAVISGILMKNDIIPDVQNLLSASDFFLPAHQEIYDAILKLTFASTPADITTLAGYLRNNGKLEFIGGPVYLSEIAAVPSSSMHAIDYAKIVFDLAKRRRLLQAIDDAKNAALMPGDTRSVSSEIEKIIFSATQNKTSTNMARVSDLLMDAMQDFENRANNQGVVNGVLTGLKDLDKTLFGMRPGQLIVLAARPGMGKTSLACNFMYHVAVKQAQNVLFFSLEMTRMEVLERLFAQASGVDSSKLRSGHLQAKDFSDLCFAAEKLEKASFYIDDRSILTPYDVLAQANRLRSTLNIQNQGAKIDLIVVDYIQIMKSGSNYENRSLEVAAITGGLKAIAKDLGVPVVALSQLNREGSKRAGGQESKKPQLSDLRDSGAIEADADVVMFIHREQGSETDSRAPAPAEIIVAKQRGGPTGTIPVVWLGHLTQFSDAIDSSHLPEGIPDGPGEYIPSPDTY